MKDITLTPEQKEVVQAACTFITDCYESDNPLGYITIGGYAGTGKTTIIRSIRELFGKEKRFHYMAFTGKAAMRINQTLGEEYFSDYFYDQVGTIHQAIYKTRRDSVGRFMGFSFNPHKTTQDIIVVDEASMVPRSIFDDLMKKNVPIIFIGDHGQLPPIPKKGEEPFNLMEEPFHTLSKIHRNADGIKQFATAIRLKESLGDTYPNVSTCKHKNISFENFNTDKDIIIVGGNYTRVKLNNSIKQQLGFNKELEIGMKVIALRNNWRSDPPMFNGQIFFVEEILNNEEEKYTCVLRDEFDNLYPDVEMAKYAFGNPKPYAPKSKVLTNRSGEAIYIPYTPFDYAYAITCHKSQGSEWDNVIVVNESYMFRKSQAEVRWLYTAVTRAAKNLTVYNL